MARLAKDVMTPHPACCHPDATLESVAKLMVEHDCGEIPVVDAQGRPVGVITDRDIVCRIVAGAGNPTGRRVDSVMTQNVVTVQQDTAIEDVIGSMERHRIRRIPVVDEHGCCVGIIAQADLASTRPASETAEFVREVSKGAYAGAPQLAARLNHRIRTLTLPFQKFGFIVGTRAALGVGIGVLLSNRFPAERRKWLGTGLVALGAAATIPAAYWVSRGVNRAA
jgi:CBS domain-containing protein